MIKILVAVFASFAVASLSGCAGIGKGKGKAPPPVEEPVAEPIIK
jgi:hypothetical protein